MCGKGKGNNPFGSFQGWQEWHSKWAADPLGLGLTDYSGNLISKVVGSPTLDERYAEKEALAAKKRDIILRRAAESQAADPGPTKTASLVNPASEIANRRRKALLDARRSLTPQSGLGANAPLY